MIKDKKLYDDIAILCGNIDMPFYQRLLLVNMVYRKVRHPSEKIDDIIKKVTEEVVPEQYKKYKNKDCMRLSFKHEKGNLERELHKCDDIPEELLNGDVVVNVVKYYAKEVLDLN